MGRRGFPAGGSDRRGKPTYAAGAPECPSWLSPAAKRVFKRTAAELLTAKTVAVIDVDVIAAYASAVADLEAISKALDAAGVVITTETVDRNGRPTGHTVTRPNPLLKAKAELYGRVRQLADALGLMDEKSVNAAYREMRRRARTDDPPGPASEEPPAPWFRCDRSVVPPREPGSGG